MNLLIWLAFGAIAGFIAHKVDPFPVKGGLFATILFGLAGALGGGLVASRIFGTTSGFDMVLLIIAVSTTLFLLLVQRTALSK